MENLTQFGEATGLQVNMSKSSTMPVCCDAIDLATVLLNFGGHTAALPIRYLRHIAALAIQVIGSAYLLLLWQGHIAVFHSFVSLIARHKLISSHASLLMGSPK